MSAGLCAAVFPRCLQKRAALLTSGHVATGRVPSVEEANTAENILVSPSACQPRVAYGCSLDELLPLARLLRSTAVVPALPNTT